MVSTHDILFAVLLPAVISLLIMVIGWRPWSRGTPRGEWAGAVAIGVSFSIGLLGLQHMPDLREMSVGQWITQAIHQLPGLPPGEAQAWLFHVGWVVALLGIIDAAIRLPQIVRLLVMALISAVTVTLVLLIKRSDGWGTQESPLWIGCCVAGMVAAFWIFERANKKLNDATVPLLMTMAAGGLGLFMMFSAAPTDGQRAGIITAAMAPITLLAFFSKRISLARGGVMAFVTLFGGLLAICYFYPDHVTTYQLLIIAASPLVGLIPTFTKLQGWKRLLACFLLTGILLGFAAVSAGIQFVREMNSPSNYSEN